MPFISDKYIFLYIYNNIFYILNVFYTFVTCISKFKEIVSLVFYISLSLFIINYLHGNFFTSCYITIYKFLFFIKKVLMIPPTQPTSPKRINNYMRTKIVISLAKLC